MNYFIVEDVEAGKFLDLTLGENGDVCFRWEFNPDNVKPIIDKRYYRDFLESMGLCKSDYLWHKCNQQGEWI